MSLVLEVRVDDHRDPRFGTFNRLHEWLPFQPGLGRSSILGAMRLVFVYYRVFSRGGSISMSEDVIEYAYLAGAQCAEDWLNDQSLGLTLLWEDRTDAWLWWKSIHKDPAEYEPLRRAFESGWESYMNSLELDE